MRIIRTLIAVALLGVVAAGSSLAVADSYPPGGVTVVPGVAILSKAGSVTFTGGGFAPGTTVMITVNGSAHGVAVSTSTGGFAVQIAVPGTGKHSFAANGRGATGSVHVVTATLTIVAPVQPSAALAAGAVPAYEALASGFAVVAVAVLLLLGFRLLSRVPSAP